MLAGYFRRLDAPLMRLVDAMMAFPDILLGIALGVHSGRYAVERDPRAHHRLYAPGSARA